MLKYTKKNLVNTEFKMYFLFLMLIDNEYIENVLLSDGLKD